MASPAFEMTTLAGLTAMSLGLFVAGAFAWVVPDFLTYIGKMPDPSPFTQLVFFPWVFEGAYLLILLFEYPPELVIVVCFGVISGATFLQPVFTDNDVERWPSRFVGVVLGIACVGLTLLLL